MSDDSVKGAQPNRRSPDEDKLKDLVAQSDEVGDELGKRMQARFYDWVGARRWIEDDWLSYIRAYHGMYEAEVSDQLQPGGSDVFVQLTRMKTDTSYNRICDLMFGAEKPWELKPSPMPELPDERKAELREMIMANTMANQDMMLDVLPPMDEELEKVETDLAKKAAKKMKVKIEDQLEFCHWERKARATIFEMCVLGTGCFKGPMIAINKRNKYRRTKNGWSLSSAEEIMPKMDSPSMFDIFSDPYATEEGAGIGTYERHMLRQDQVERLAGQPLFNKKKIEELLDRYPKGNHWETYTDIELRFVTNNTSHGEPELRYDVIEYWGWVDGMTLMQSGMTDGVEEGRSYYCNIWHCGGITIRAIVDPKRPQKDMYKLVPYKELIASQYGVGVPHLMKDSQETVNAAARELINNAALSSGPQVEVAVDLIDLDANEDIRKIEPWRVWPRAGGDLAYPAVRFTNIPNTTESMARIIQIWRQFADEETNIPSYTHGSTQLTGAAGKTASGMSMLMGAASMDIKGVVKNIDNYLIKPFIEEMYHFNMQWSDDDKIKGDLEPQALGSTSLLAKEIKSQRVVMLLEMTNNPVDQAIMGLERRAKLLRSAGEAMDIDPNDMAPDPDEESIEESMMNNQQGPGAVGGPGMAGQPGEIPGTLTPATSGARSPSSGAGPDITPGGPGMTQGVPPVAPATGQV
jgi:hypothetical protein